MLKWFYLRDKKNFPVACVASDISVEDSSWIKFAVATFNPRDHDRFNKHTALGYAVSRLYTQPQFVEKTKGMKEQIMIAIQGNSSFPQRARDAAALWLKMFYERKRVESAVQEFESLVENIQQQTQLLESM